MFNKNKLKAVMIESGENVRILAKFMNITPVAVYHKMNTGSFSRDDIQAIKNHYALDAHQVDSIFFVD